MAPSWALPKPEPSLVSLGTVRSQTSTSESLPVPAKQHGSAPAAPPRRRLPSPSPFMPKSKGKGNDYIARMSDEELALAIDRSASALKRAGTSAAAVVLTKRFDNLQLEANTRRLRRTTIDDTPADDEATPDGVRLRLEQIHFGEAETPPSSRTRSARHLSPRLGPRAKIETVDWDEGERLLKEEWKRDMELRRAAEELENKRLASHPNTVRGLAAAKQAGLQHFMSMGAAEGDDEDEDDDDEDDTDDESLRGEME